MATTSCKGSLVFITRCPGCAQEYNLKYVDLIEEQLNEALTTYRKPVDGDNYVRRSNQRQGDGGPGSALRVLGFPLLATKPLSLWPQVTKTKCLSPCALVRPAGPR